MRIKQKPRTKTCDLHIRLSKENHEVLKKISSLKETTITNLIEAYISELEVKHSI